MTSHNPAGFEQISPYIFSYKLCSPIEHGRLGTWYVLQVILFVLLHQHHTNVLSHTETSCYKGKWKYILVHTRSKHFNNESHNSASKSDIKSYFWPQVWKHTKYRPVWRLPNFKTSTWPSPFFELEHINLQTQMKTYNRHHFMYLYNKNFFFFKSMNVVMVYLITVYLGCA